MSVAAQLTLALASVGVLLSVMAAIRRLASTLSLSAEVQRKLVHVITGIYALALPWLFPDGWPVYVLVALTLGIMVLLRIPRIAGRLGQTLHGVERQSYGEFCFALAIGLCFFLAQGNTLLYVLPIAVVALGDAAAALAGSAYGRMRFKVERGEKSIEGTATFFVVTFVIALVCLFTLADLPPPNAVALALMVAAFGALVEAQSWRGFDNLFLPLGLLIFLRVHGESDLQELAWIAGIFLIAILGFLVIGPRLGLSPHASRVYVVAMFLILAMTAPQNALFPALALVAHGWAAARNPSEDTYGELDIAAALAFISFGWLALGRALDWNAIAFYGLTAMGLTMGLSVLALRGRLIGVVAVGAALLALHAITFIYGGAASGWAEPLWALAVFSVLLPATATLLRPEIFANDRVLKLTVLALILPGGYYLYTVAVREGVISGVGGVS